MVSRSANCCVSFTSHIILNTTCYTIYLQRVDALASMWVKPEARPKDSRVMPFLLMIIHPYFRWQNLEFVYILITISYSSGRLFFSPLCVHHGRIEKPNTAVLIWEVLCGVVYRRGCEFDGRNTQWQLSVLHSLEQPVIYFISTQVALSIYTQYIYSVNSGLSTENNRTIYVSDWF